ncbi:MAG: L,D-transpeptidase family protein [Alphaproteobacteria bacterium]|nr:L,D-transpeptidase family protein [Alphaproteobacteria bacterium]
MNIRVLVTNGHRGTLVAGAEIFPCALGPAGIQLQKREGDGVTPAGRFQLRAIWYRADRIARPDTALPINVITPDDGWCDAPKDDNYNRPVKLPYRASAEALWRDDHVYDLVVILGHNDDPVIPHKGSAIFLHIANPDFRPTEGCVAIQGDALNKLVAVLDANSCLEIMAT